MENKKQRKRAFGISSWEKCVSSELTFGTGRRCEAATGMGLRWRVLTYMAHGMTFERVATSFCPPWMRWPKNTEQR